MDTSHSMKTNIYYSNTPTQIRIKSEKLCLDHIFHPEFSKPCITFEDIQIMINSPLIDEIWLYLNEGDLVYVDCVSKKFESVVPRDGCWFCFDPEQFNFIDRNKINVWDVTEP